MVRGMSAASRLVALLFEEVANQNGYEEILFYLTTKRGRANLQSTVQHLLSLEWRVRKSVIMQMAREECADDEYMDNDERFFWEPALQKLKLPYVCFYAMDNESGDGGPARNIEELRSVLAGKPATPGMVVLWNDENHVVTSIQKDQGNLLPGDPIDVDSLEFVHLTPIHYFDLEN